VFAKHPGCYSPREFESLPLRRSLLRAPFRGVAQLVEHPSPNVRLNEVHLFLLQECSITEAKVIKARPHLTSKEEGDNSMARKVW
jgi:hypothetical protein